MSNGREGRAAWFHCHTPEKQKSWSHPENSLDFDFADDIALVSNLADQAQELLHRVKSECRKVGLRLNAKKTEVMAFNIDQWR